MSRKQTAKKIDRIMHIEQFFIILIVTAYTVVFTGCFRGELMRVAVPVDDQRRIVAHTGLAEGFLIYDIWESSPSLLEYREYIPEDPSNPCISEIGETCKSSNHSQIIRLISDCQILIARGVGERLLDDLFAFGIETIFCRNKTTETAVKMFARGELPRFTDSLTGCCRIREMTEPEPEPAN